MIYVHVPFCASRCGYCDFAAFAGIDELAPRYVGAVLAELTAADPPPAETVYVGGGTPSQLSPRLLERLVSAVPRAPGAEVTVEANPESATPEALRALRAAGANRLSLGMQSSVPHVLAALERRHDPEYVPRAVRRARAEGFANLNLDLIFGTPGEADADWRTSLETALSLEPTHVSAYALTVVPGTPLGWRVAAGLAASPDEDEQGRRLDIADAVLGAAGFLRYEVSNWALPGFECRHNDRTWQREPYLGVGCAAHSFDGSRRWWNVRHPMHYTEMVESGRSPREGEEVLGPEQARVERIALGLRRAPGIPAEELGPPARAEAADLASGGLLVLDQGRVRLTPKGMAVADGVIIRLLQADECSSASSSTLTMRVLA